jgi:hypothetical protein
MNRAFWMLPVITAVVLATAAAHLPEKTVLSELAVGQSVGLKDHGSSYEISVMDVDIPRSHTVVEIGPDFIVLEDVAAVTRTTIPVYSVKGIVRLSTRNRQNPD